MYAKYPATPMRNFQNSMITMKNTHSDWSACMMVSKSITTFYRIESPVP